ncbi:C40 family peptidase [Mucilaginibacter celer]|uniref:NlpC/P60 family protein n=1 Tax=Mucilaginibacter celer TaxID=2305508 RepID=A0A494VV88_9SPHI|nr:C40 family peptidase [Mucilaginibacter celer]AYL97981.1 NlpC/P60 family protein [Mucilaginibacter celer]
MHFAVGPKLLLIAFLSFSKPVKPAAHHVSKKYKANKTAKAHRHTRVRHHYAEVEANYNTGEITPAELVEFAQTLKGTRYCYGSTNPERGFDCSGFVNYVFTHFGISIPRSSSDFAPVKGIDISEARFGDLILFTGTRSHNYHSAGHIGIVISQPGEPLVFIHSTSGAENGVTETAMNDLYQRRYIKTIRVFKDEAPAVEEETTAEATEMVAR